MRTFIAIPLDDQVHGELAQVQARLKHADAGLKWVDPSNIHLTLKFLGEIDPQRLPHIKESLQKILLSHIPFHIHIHRVGAFPTPSHPRIIWAGIREGIKECILLQKDIESSMEVLGFAKEGRDFSPHLTLARVSSSRNRDSLINRLEAEKEFSCGNDLLVKSIILFRSQLTAKGPIYTPIETFYLGGLSA